MYLVGAAHRHKTDAQVLIERAVASGERLVTDAEVLQEILHRYAAIGRIDAIAAALKLTLSVVDEVYPIEKADVRQDCAQAVVSLRQVLLQRDGLPQFGDGVEVLEVL